MTQGFYGDETRWFIGRVVNNTDPDQRGRIQIRIYGIHTENKIDIPNYALPWAETLLPVTEGGASGIGRIPQLLPSALVFGIFLDGKTSQQPLILGSMSTNEAPSSVQRLAASGRGDAAFFTPEALGQNGTVVSPTLRSNFQNGNATIDQRRVICMNFFTENGLSPIAAAGITGNLEAESNFNPGVVSEFVNESSQGIAQWNPDAGRLQKLKRFATRQNKDFLDIFTQLEYIIHELRGKSVNNDGGGSFATLNTKLSNCTTFEGGVNDFNSTWLFVKIYEVPADMKQKLPKREQFARKAFEQWSTAVSNAAPDRASGPR
jgi:hypothetical protein